MVNGGRGVEVGGRGDWVPYPTLAPGKLLGNFSGGLVVIFGRFGRDVEEAVFGNILNFGEFALLGEGGTDLFDFRCFSKLSSS